MRIIAGRFKGLPIPAALTGTRPTTDRTKEAIFSRLDAWGVLEDARVLDLYAGTGALGFEALSRGASSLVAVEASRKAASLIARTVKQLQASPSWTQDDQAQVLALKAEIYVRSGESSTQDQQAADSHSQPFDLIFIDPPYDLSTEACNDLLTALVTNGLAASDAVIILERSTRSQSPKPPQAWTITETKTYGETAVHYLESISK